MAAIHWTKELRAQISPRTKDEAGTFRDPEKLWRTIRDSWKPAANGFNPHVHRFEMARKHSHESMFDVIDRARAFVTSALRPSTPPGADAAGYALAMHFGYTGATALFDVVASYGAELAQDAVIFAHGLKMATPSGNYTVQLLVREARDGTFFAERLRDVILAASDDARARCVEKAGSIFPNADFWLKLTLAIAHPSKPEWAAAVGRAVLENRTMRYPPIEGIFRSLRELELVEPLLERRSSVRAFVDLVETFGDGVLRPLLGVLEKPRDRGELRGAAFALTAYESEEVAHALASLLLKKEVREPAIPWFLRFPALARAALDPIATGKNKIAKYAAEILEQVGRTTTAEEATLEELPWVLAHPPWIEKRRGRRKGAKRLELALLPREETVVLPQEEQVRILQFAQGQPNANAPPMTADEARDWQEKLEKGESVGLWSHAQKLVPEDRSIAAFNEDRPNLASNRELDPWIALARFGVPVLPGFVRYIEERFDRAGGYWINAILGVDSPRLAKALVPHLEHATAWRWMTEHLDAAFVALIPAALGSDKNAALAEVKLRLLASMGHREKLLAVASEYGEEAREAIEEILTRDARFDCPARAPRMPPTWRPETLHRPLLKNGKALPLAALEPLGHMLHFSKLDAPYAGLRDVAEACEPRSLAEFSWSLARSWEIAGAKSKDVWMLYSLAHFADDEVTRRTTPAIKDPHILIVLGTIATDAAAMELATIIARKERSSSGSAEAQFERIAQKRGVTVDELEDRITPTEGLDADGGTTLDYGSRTLRVGFDTMLAPYVMSESGERVRQLPPKRKADDKAMIASAQARWHDLKEDVATIAERRIRSLERAMASGRSWSKQEFLDVWVTHPLLFHMARGIVWAAPSFTFRVAEDRTFAGIHDEPLEIPDDARVNVPHRLDLGADADRWHQIFLDYRIIPPIDQLTRAVHTLGDAEKDAGSLERALPIPMPYGIMAAALARAGFPAQGWQGNVRYNRRPLGRTPDVVAQVEYTYIAGDVKTVVIRFLRNNARFPPSEVHPVELSEIVRAVLSLQPT